MVAVRWALRAMVLLLPASTWALPAEVSPASRGLTPRGLVERNDAPAFAGNQLFTRQDNSTNSTVGDYDPDDPYGPDDPEVIPIHAELILLAEPIKVYILFNGEITKDLVLDVQIFFHLGFDYKIGAYHVDLKKGIIDVPLNLKVVKGEAKVYLEKQDDGYEHIMAHADGRAFIPFKGSKTFDVTKSLYRFKIDGKNMGSATIAMDTFQRTPSKSVVYLDPSSGPPSVYYNDADEVPGPIYNAEFANLSASTGGPGLPSGTAFIPVTASGVATS